MTEPKIALQNDWTKLEEAVKFFHEDWFDPGLETHCDIQNSTQGRYAVDAVVELVPKLLESYAELWELSMNLAAAWEQERAGISPAGLVLPK